MTEIDWRGRYELVRHVPSGELFALEFFPDGRIFCSSALSEAMESLPLKGLNFEEDISFEFEPEEYEVIRTESID